ncbi:site-specific DNA-methyltransferase [Sphingobacterium faecium NBRC 15299]|uniref:DNA adenine methylase n=1 Tax=Sphingobacterium faecium TaxID=34087 RepID=UPI000D39EDF0|nr:DNA adenine methylase [Sphingobacterium faecium]PTX11832.1 adenine-specific DNA-methyltransferase [Sphingobacterium faecium]GEM63393.1 site-specific DNA-methyltransferase [Sphingobacterium faecium NBRC 15299]
MSIQEIATEVEVKAKIPHILKYMGSKREILGFVQEAIEALDVKAEWFCDLFSGTSVVAGTFKNKYNVMANDVQMYSAIFSNTYLSDLNGNFSIEDLDMVLQEALSYRNEFLKIHSELSFKYLEDITYEKFDWIENQQRKLIDHEFKIGFHLFAKYFSGTYWSYEQCVWIDSFRAVAEKYKGSSLYYVILSSLIFGMSYMSQSTGHYAQYRDLTDSNFNDILSYRKRDIIPYFKRKFTELITMINGTKNRKYLVTTMDYLDCLRIIPEGTIVYADPPYQSVHYSRFYHALETLVRYDYPTVKYKGRYREDRHQSPFCLKTKVEDAFINMFKAVKARKAHISLSYADTGMISKEKITKLGEEIFGSGYKVQILSKSHVHSKMGRSDEKEHDVEEYIINFRRNGNTA